MNKPILKPKNLFFILKSTTNFRISTKSSLNLNTKLKPKLLSPVVGPKQQSSSITREWVNHANWTINSNLGNSNTNKNVVQKLICNQLESVADLAQNCSGLSDPTLTYFRKLCESGTELDHFIRGQSTLLLATSLVIESNQKYDPKLLEQQILFSKLTEFTHLAFVLHHKIIDTRENVDNSIKQHNKIITILGDYLISDVYFNLAQMNQSVALLSQFGTLWRNLSEDLFSNLENEGFKRFASIFAHSFKSAVILANIGNETSQDSAFEFGKNFGFYLKAIQDVEIGIEIVDEQKMKIFKENALNNLGKLQLNEQGKQCFHKLFDVKIY